MLWLRRYFKPIPGKRSFAVDESIKNGILWEVRDLLSNPPPETFHIIFLRNNLLTYYEDGLTVAPLKRILNHLVAEGFLIIGSHETIPSGAREHLTAFGRPWLFQKKR